MMIFSFTQYLLRAQAAMVKKCLAAGACGYILKPFNRESILEGLRIALEQ
jgi:AmiR/NasT family two-component response regulator